MPGGVNLLLHLIHLRLVACERNGHWDPCSPLRLHSLETSYLSDCPCLY